MPSYLPNNTMDLLSNNKKDKSKKRAIFRTISTKTTFILKAAFT
jgi:hypothetical protein